MPVACRSRRLAGALLFSALLAAAGAEGGCVGLGRCCSARSLECVSAGWRPDGSYGPCYCDQACLSTLDCCRDYRQFCPEASCLLSDWSEWSGCAERCKVTYRIRRRRVIQEPRNGGEACPPLEEKAGCLEYWTQQGTLCKHAFRTSYCTGRLWGIQGVEGPGREFASGTPALALQFTASYSSDFQIMPSTLISSPVLIHRNSVDRCNLLHGLFNILPMSEALAFTPNILRFQE